ncbi:hypothetical protein BJY01DRAFT_260894 [Aspergillus pseudoustus]|uniref:6-phosphogluconate dehydrogenase NADP-binding domain-containing protein n=1 Tax=Aspergillus pseudoustus TaxID=1810923 RepID=A0ABR4IRU8_9EURO
MSTNVTVIGLGAMGTALAAAFLEKRYPTSIWNRTAARAAPLIDKGAQLSSSVSAAYDSSDIVIFCVLNNSIVQELLRQDATRLKGKIIINSTNGTLQEARGLSEFVQAHGAQYLHAAVMAVPTQIGTDHGFIIYSGHEGAYDSIRAHLSILGEDKYIGSDPGSASLHDSALLSGVYGVFSGFLHAAVLVSSQQDKTAAGFMDMYVKFITSMMDYLRALARQIDNGNYEPLGSSLRIQVDALKNICEVTESQGLSSELLKPIQALVEKGLGAGHSNSDISALGELLRR